MTKTSLQGRRLAAREVRQALAWSGSARLRMLVWESLLGPLLLLRLRAVNEWRGRDER